MADSPETPTAVAEAPPPDDTAQYAALLGTGERVLVVRRRHLFSLVEGARWFFAAVGVAIVLEVINGIVPNGRLTNWLGSTLTGASGCSCSSGSRASAGTTSSGSGSGTSSRRGG